MMSPLLASSLIINSARHVQVFKHVSKFVVALALTIITVLFPQSANAAPARPLVGNLELDLLSRCVHGVPDLSLSLTSKMVSFARCAHAASDSSLSVTSNLPAGTVGVPYSGAIIVTGGTSPYTFLINDGALPAGLTLDSTTGTITGTPTGVASKFFWVRVTDANGARANLHAQISVVNNSTSVSITISPTSASVGSGGTQQFSAT